MPGPHQLGPSQRNGGRFRPPKQPRKSHPYAHDNFVIHAFGCCVTNHRAVTIGA